MQQRCADAATPLPDRPLPAPRAAARGAGRQVDPAHVLVVDGVFEQVHRLAQRPAQRTASTAGGPASNLVHQLGVGPARDEIGQALLRTALQRGDRQPAQTSRSERSRWTRWAVSSAAVQSPHSVGASGSVSRRVWLNSCRSSTASCLTG